MPRLSVHRAADRKLEEGEEGGGRYVDLQFDWVNGETGELVTRWGGRWDRLARGVDGDAKTSRVIKLHAGQVEKAEWFCDWYDSWLERQDPDYKESDADKKARVFSALYAGGRRGGKTWLATACTIAFAISNPDTISWIVAPTGKDYEEIEDYLDFFLPRAWYQKVGSPWNRWTFANNARIVLRSAHDPNALKKGTCHFGFLNEGQKMNERAYTNTRGGLSDGGGMLLVAANPPDVGDQGDWVADFAVDAQSDRRKAKYWFFDPLDNPPIDVDALLALADEIDEHTFNTQVRGMFLAPKGAVFYNWNRTKNERPLPEVYEDITAKFSEHHEHAAYDDIVAIDVNRFPYIAASCWKIVANPKYPSFTRAIAWCWDEVSMEGGDEHDVATELIERGYDPRRTLVIMDASGWWQSTVTMTAGKNQKLGKDGMSSAKIFRGYGFRVVRPDRRMEKNPSVVERCRATCARIQTKAKQRYMFVDPRCKQTAKAMQRWQTKHGKPERTSEFAHHGDGVSYFVWRFWPRRIGGDTVGSGRSKKSNRRKGLGSGY